MVYAPYLLNSESSNAAAITANASSGDYESGADGSDGNSEYSATSHDTENGDYEVTEGQDISNTVDGNAQSAGSADAVDSSTSNTDVINSTESSEDIASSSIASDNAISGDTASNDSASSGYVDGTYTGSAFGYNDDVTVSVTIEGGQITDINVVSSLEDDPYFTWVLQQIPDSIIETQSPDVDTVTGATTSSKAYIHAVEAALDQAK